MQNAIRQSCSTVQQSNLSTLSGVSSKYAPKRIRGIGGRASHRPATASRFKITLIYAPASLCNGHHVVVSIGYHTGHSAADYLEELAHQQFYALELQRNGAIIRNWETGLDKFMICFKASFRIFLDVFKDCEAMKIQDVSLSQFQRLSIAMEKSLEPGLF
ncbi:phosphotransferase enzyme family protein [Penicillium coprophilum]|uniref:phosphotransferase enzyme family protein n=1 Tax=Penicillium coprophilum TaxID=36646 RepID=UPI0023A4DC5C|nr:phosphotransferase enzyme family protein [Penicillium coprophilum]KAJ5163318.1 phosphotransferase enzyme family protein [Penicillium coprophilum]